MPKNPSLKKVLIIGSGPIVIGQGCEFDYSGTQACKALREEGCHVILVNSNPASIMTDPGIADTTYLEPITIDVLEKIIERERPDAILPTMGGQTALNCTLELAKNNILSKFSVRVIGLSLDTIEYAENRMAFKELIQNIGLPSLPYVFIRTMDDLVHVEKTVGFPAMVRSSYTLGGNGGGTASTLEELEPICQEGLALSPSGILIEQSIEGWKEIELEVMRDHTGTCIVVCGIENIDPIGVHTGDSIVVAPIQTLTDKEYQRMRAQAFIVMKSVGMTSGGCNVQFAVHPTTGECICIEINPRVSRSSALASKATGFPIAKIAAKLALGYSLHELRNDLSHLPASFEPTLDYVVVKMPYFNFDKFPTANTRLTSSMKSVGEAMAIGRTFQEAFQKAIESLDREYLGLKYSATEQDETLLEKKLIEPSPERLWLIGMAFRQKWSLEKIQRATTYDPWFLREIESLMATEAQISQISLADLKQSDLLSWKQKGFSDKRVASLLNTTEEKVWNIRHSLCITPTYKRIDSCAAEFPVTTPCLYSSYEEECESRPTSKQKIIVLGSGPNRIGQGLEFDYCCVHAIQAIKDLGFEAIIINCNPSTVSTDYDISDRLYIEPLTLERIHDVVVLEKPLGLMIQCGGQSPLNVGRQLAIRGVPILGTPFPSIDCCEDRGKFRETLKKLSLNQPRNTTVSHKHHAIEAATTIGYPIIVRPSYVIGGASIHLIKNEQELQEYMLNFPSDFDPILVEEALTEGIEVEVDAIADGVDVFICGIIEHLDPVGIHSGDSICSLSPRTLSLQIQHELKDQTQKLALSLRIVGLLNVQFCVVDQKTIYILEVNPRASRTIPLLSKVAALPFVQIAMRCILGQSLLSQGHSGEALHYHFGVKVPVFPFHKMGVKDTALGPRMLSTGEILGIGVTFQEAFAKGATCIDTEHSLSPSVKKELFLISKIDNNSIDRL